MIVLINSFSLLKTFYSLLTAFDLLLLTLYLVPSKTCKFTFKINSLQLTLGKKATKTQGILEQPAPELKQNIKFKDNY